MSKRDNEQGYVLITALVTCFFVAIIAVIAAGSLMNNIKSAVFQDRSDQALAAAEAGISYYRWHLTHNPDDFKDGNTGPATAPYGPYMHNYYGNNGALVGTYTLTITPPSVGSTVATVKSVGRVNGLPGSRSVTARLGRPSFAENLFLSNEGMVFSSTSTTYGSVFSNGCIEFNGTNHGNVTSAQSSCGYGRGGVWGSGGPSGLWSWPAVVVDFTSVTADLNSYESLSTSGGVNLGNSGGMGWYLKLKSNGTIDKYKVTNESSSGISTSYKGNFPVPSNGIVYSAEETWVSGTEFPGRVTIVAAKLPDSSSTRRSIKVIDNLTIAEHDGSAAIGLIAQKDVFIPEYVPSIMRVEAAMIAQYGSVGYDTENGGLKDEFSLFGSIAQNQNNYGFKVNGCGGYCRGFPTTNYTYDSNLLYSPPPFYPTTGLYSILSWRE